MHFLIVLVGGTTQCKQSHAAAVVHGGRDGRQCRSSTAGTARVLFALFSASGRFGGGFGDSGFSSPFFLFLTPAAPVTGQCIYTHRCRDFTRWNFGLLFFGARDGKGTFAGRSNAQQGLVGHFSKDINATRVPAFVGVFVAAPTVMPMGWGKHKINLMLGGFYGRGGGG